MFGIRRATKELCATLREILDENSRLKDDNAKLRELVQDMWGFFFVVPDEPHVFKEEIDFSTEVWKRMRELGIEVRNV